MSGPAWWDDADEVTWASEEERQEAKVAAARQVVGFLLNVSSDSADAVRVHGWFEPDDFPGVLATVASAVWDGYDGDVMALAMRMVAAGFGGRIANGVLLSNLYWEASFAGLEEASFVMMCARRQERKIARARAELERLT